MPAFLNRLKRFRLVALVVAIYHSSQRNHITRNAAAIAYFGMLSLLPLIAVVVSAAPPLIRLLRPDYDINQAIVRLTSFTVSTVTGRWLGEVLRALGRNSAAVDAIGLLGFGWAALNVFGQLEGAIRRVWQDGVIDAREGFQLKAAATTQITQRGRALVLLLLALADFGLNNLSSLLLTDLRGDLPRGWAPIVMPIAVNGLTWITGAIFILLLYRFFIPGRPAWGRVGLVAALVSAANLLIRYAVVQRFVDGTLGASTPAVGGPIALLLWAFLLSQNLLLGVALVREWHKGLRTADG
ncbi:MAG: YhjD/YihY/BrkB family envelope integrity protein [Thermoflexales bacterium]